MNYFIVIIYFKVLHDEEYNIIILPVFFFL